MGQSLSSTRSASAAGTWPEVQTLEQFKERVQLLLSRSCIFPKEAQWLEAITAKFGTVHEDVAYWTELDMEAFLALTLPENLQDHLHTAAPLVHLCLTRLSSFPYLDNPATTSPALTKDRMSVALSFVVQRHVDLAPPTGITGSNRGSSEALAHGTRTLLFRGMRRVSDSRATTVDSEKEGPASARTREDDDHLLQAHHFISALNRGRSPTFPTFFQDGPPIVAPEDLPTSNSADYSGAIPARELTSLLHICKSLGRLSSDTESETPVDAPLPGRESNEIAWKDFNALIAPSEEQIYNGLARLFTPFLAATVKVEQIQGATKPEAMKLLRTAGRPAASAREHYVDDSI